MKLLFNLIKNIELKHSKGTFYWKQNTNYKYLSLCQIFPSTVTSTNKPETITSANSVSKPLRLHPTAATLPRLMQLKYNEDTKYTKSKTLNRTPH